MLRSPLSAHVVRSCRRELDALLIRGPSPLLPTLARAARGVPTALLIVGDYVAGCTRFPAGVVAQEPDSPLGACQCPRPDAGRSADVDSGQQPRASGPSASIATRHPRNPNHDPERHRLLPPRRHLWAAAGASALRRPHGPRQGPACSDRSPRAIGLAGRRCRARSSRPAAARRRCVG